MIIDCHTHGMHADYLQGMRDAAGAWVDERLASAMGKPVLTNVPARVAQMDRHGYDIQVVTPQWSFDANLCPDQEARIRYSRALNDNMARMQEESKGRLLCTANVPLENYEQDGRKETERAIKTLGLRGLFLSTHVRGKPIDLPDFEIFWAHAAELDIPVLIHPADAVSSVSRPYEGRFDLMRSFGWPYESILMLSGLVFSGLMEKYPNLKIASHHLGGGIPFIIGRATEHYDGRIQELTGKPLTKPITDYFSLFYYDTAVGPHAPAIRCTYDTFGIDRIVFATDAPFGPRGGDMRMEAYPKIVTSVGLSEAENKKIFEANPRRLFKI